MSEFEKERSSHRTAIQKLEAKQAETAKKASDTANALSDAMKEIAAQSAVMAGQEESSTTLRELQSQLDASKEESHFTSQARL